MEGKKERGVEGSTREGRDGGGEGRKGGKILKRILVMSVGKD